MFIAVSMVLFIWKPDHLKFAVEANIKSLCPKSSRGSILKSQNGVYMKHEYQPSLKMVEY